jgi:hypothetical protein
MGQVTVHVTLTNAREFVISRLRHPAPEAVHTCDIEALVENISTVDREESPDARYLAHTA